MDGRYSEALERQVELIRFWRSDRGIRTGNLLRDSLVRVRGATPYGHHIALMRASELEHGETYYLSGELLDVVDQAAAVLPEGATLDLSALPSFSGWLYFGKPLPLPAPPTDYAPWHWKHMEQDGALLLRGVSWEGAIREDQPGELGDRLSGVDILRDANEVAMTFYLQDPLTSGLEIHSFMDWPTGEPWDHWTNSSEPADATEYEGFRICRRFMLAFFAFVGQRILGYRQERADRPARRRLERQMEGEPLVRVIELRRREYERHETAERRDVEWSCQWITRGHWHRYHTKDGLQPRWVAPYLKGPSDKPLKRPRADVFAVVR